jgi:hypothetical protein
MRTREDHIRFRQIMNRRICLAKDRAEYALLYYRGRNLEARGVALKKRIAYQASLDPMKVPQP